MCQQRCHFDHLVVGTPIDLIGIAAAIDDLEPFANRLRRCGGLRIWIGFTPVLQRLLNLVTQTTRGPSQVRFKYLSDVHSAWHAQRIEHDVDERSRSEEHTSELQSLMRISYAVFCLKKKTKPNKKY